MSKRQPAKGRQSQQPVTRTRATASSAAGRSSGTTTWIVGGLVAIVAVVVVGFLLLSGNGSAGDPGTVIQGSGGSWTNITPDRLSAELKAKDFTFLNVKTPYIGEIEGTDLYIPYTDLTARAAELPADKSAKIVVYCRSGNESAIASQTLLDMGYTNIENLDGGMNAWQQSGRSIVNLGRS